MAGDVKVSDKAVKAATAEMVRWGINPPYLLAAIQDALQAAFDAQARYDEVSISINGDVDPAVMDRHISQFTGYPGWKS